MLLLATVALTGCRFAEHGRRAAIDAFASFVLDSVFQMQSAAPLTEKTAQVARTEVPAPKRECPLAVELPKPVVTVTAPLPLPAPQRRIAAVDLTPAAELCSVTRVRALVHAEALVAARLEARMALALLRGKRAERVHRVVVIVDPDVDPDPATL